MSKPGYVLEEFPPRVMKLIAFAGVHIELSKAETEGVIAAVRGKTNLREAVKDELLKLRDSRMRSA